MTTDDTTRPLSTDLGLDDDAPHTDAADAGPDTPAGPPAPRYRSGPAPFAVLLGILGLATAGAVLISELADVRVPWADLGPWTIVAGGVLVLLVGVVGLRSNRGQD